MPKKNELISELIKNKITNSKNIEKFISETRDSKSLNVLYDKNLDIFFLDKILTGDNFYIKQKIEKSINSSFVKLNNKYISLVNNNDNIHRENILSKYLKKKSICDFGCGIGDNFNLLKKFSSELSGVEISKKKLYLLKKNFQKIPIKNNILSFKNNFDVITMFHVLAHLPRQIEFLRKIHKKLNKNGILFIETLHSNDLLSKHIKLKEYNKFRFSKEFLILHSEKSITKILKHVGFTKVNVIFHQRYNYLNQLNWIYNKKPNGHETLKKFFNKHLDKKIKKTLSDNKKTDTLIILAKK